jgi:hypothetical protein
MNKLVRWCFRLPEATATLEVLNPSKGKRQHWKGQLSLLALWWKILTCDPEHVKHFCKHCGSNWHLLVCWGLTFGHTSSSSLSSSLGLEFL